MRMIEADMRWPNFWQKNIARSSMTETSISIRKGKESRTSKILWYIAIKDVNYHKVWYLIPLIGIYRGIYEVLDYQNWLGESWVLEITAPVTVFFQCYIEQNSLGFGCRLRSVCLQTQYLPSQKKGEETRN